MASSSHCTLAPLPELPGVLHTLPCLHGQMPLSGQFHGSVPSCHWEPRLLLASSTSLPFILELGSASPQQFHGLQHISAAHATDAASLPKAVALSLQGFCCSPLLPLPLTSLLGSGHQGLQPLGSEVSIALEAASAACSLPSLVAGHLGLSRLSCQGSLKPCLSRAFLATAPP